VFQNRVLKEIFLGLRVWRKLHRDELHDLKASNVNRTTEYFGREFKGKRQLERPRSRR